MLSINTNLSSLIAQRSMRSATSLLNQAVERMTTGYKVNHAKDNAAAYSIITQMDTKIGAYQVAEDNCAMGLDMLTTATDSLNLIYDKLTRLRDLAEQASNGTYGEQSLKAINSEANALVDEIERIYNNVEYNGTNIMKGRVTGTEESKFIKDIDRRDTSKMTTLASVKIDEALTSGTYSISTAYELAKLATMTNNGLIGAGTEFVLANDIDLGHIANWTPIGAEMVGGVTITDTEKLFQASFDGNGFVVKGLNIDTTDNIVALFGTVLGGNISNLGLSEVDIKGVHHVAGLAASVLNGATLSNCYVMGTIEGEQYVAGLVAYARNVNIQDCYTDILIKADTKAAGFIASVSYEAKSTILNCFSLGKIESSGLWIGGFISNLSNSLVKNCYTTCDVSGYEHVGSFLGGLTYHGNVTFDNCYSTGSVLSGMSGNFIGTVIGDNVVLLDSKALLPTDTIPFEILNNATINQRDSSLGLQVGSNSDENSRIITDTAYALNGLSALRKIGTGSGDYLGQCDFLLSNLSAKQTELGAVQNRLESALDEIATQYENLVSSRSTLRDADISEVSSQYIKQQILQQASATLMATANQSPSIALQLI